MEEEHHREDPNLQVHYQDPKGTERKPMNYKPMGSPYFRPDERNRALCTCITTVILIVGFLILVLWLVYRPSKPQFKVVSAAIYGINATSPPLMSATIQFTILIRNPNKRVSIYYDTLSAFVSYKNQAITPQMTLPPLYMEKHTTVSVSPVIGGSPVPVSVELLNGFVMDEAYGVVDVKLILQGRLRWKTGAITTAHYEIYVRCDLMMGLKKGFVGQVPLIGAPGCNVDI